MHPNRLAFAVELETDEDGRVVARVPDLPGCVTDGATRAEALAEASDAVEEAIAVLMEARRDIRFPSPPRGRPRILPGAVMAAKIALYMALRETGTSNVALAKRLGVAETEVRRMIDPRHKTKMARLEAGLAALGRRLVVSVDAA
ncbi:MAG: type II toxin-antitoxin system HicB family antitoxin [Pseudomonadota bacterium]